MSRWLKVIRSTALNQNLNKINITKVDCIIANNSYSGDYVTYETISIFRISRCNDDLSSDIIDMK